jgi:hypothetical protein
MSPRRWSSSPIPTHSVAGPTTTQRLIYSLSLLPIVPAAAITVATLTASIRLPLDFDPNRVGNTVIALGAVVPAIFIWRRAVVWTLGRRWLTALVGMIPFVQIIHAMPWVATSGCGTDEVLRAGQEVISAGVWVWLAVWVWWGWERCSMSEQADESLGEPARMDPARSAPPSPVARRMLASIGSVVFMVGFTLVSWLILDDLGVFNGDEDWGIMCAIAGAVAVGIWVMIWRGSVSWAPGVKTLTGLTAGLFIGVPAALIVILEDSWPGSPPEALGFLPIMGWGAWMAYTGWLWRLGGLDAPRPDGGPRCLSCGYRLRGLTSTRCPECGDERTLDELWAAQA